MGFLIPGPLPDYDSGANLPGASTPGDVVDACILGLGRLPCAETWHRYNDGAMPFLLSVLPVVGVVLLLVLVKYFSEITFAVRALLKSHGSRPLAICAAIGAPLATILGYVVQAMPSGAYGYIPFSLWLMSPIRFGVVWWTIFGAAVGAAVGYLRNFSSPSRIL